MLWHDSPSMNNSRPLRHLSDQLELLKVCALIPERKISLFLLSRPDLLLIPSSAGYGLRTMLITPLSYLLPEFHGHRII